MYLIFFSPKRLLYDDFNYPYFSSQEKRATVIGNPFVIVASLMRFELM